MSLNLVVLLTIVSAGDVVRYLVPGLAALAAHIDQSEISIIEIIWPIRDKYWDQATNQRRVLPEHGELLVEHPLELVGRHVGHALVGLQTLQLDQSEISVVSCDLSEASITWSRHQSSSSSVSTASRTLVPSSEVNKLHFRYLHAEYCQLFDIFPLRHRNNSKMWLFWNYISDMMKYNLSCFQLLNFI